MQQKKKKNARSLGNTSMPNHRQCIAQVYKTLFIFTIPLIGPNENYPVDLEVSFFLKTEMISDFFDSVMLIEMEIWPIQ